MTRPVHPGVTQVRISAAEHFQAFQVSCIIIRPFVAGLMASVLWVHTDMGIIEAIVKGRKCSFMPSK